MTAFEDSLLSDDPLKNLEEALFDRLHLVDRVVEVVGRVAAQSESSTIGLVGSWGSGKSTVLNGLMKKLRNPDPQTTEALGRFWRVAEFNPWMFSASNAMYAGFFTALRDALPDDEQWSDTKSKLITFGRRVAPLAGLAGLFGVDGKEIADSLLDQWESDVIKTRDAISAQLSELKQPILVVIDDLDRLTAVELLQVFKLVRLVARLPHVYYLLSFDEHTLIDLLSHTDLVARDDRRRALDYLEKIVQVRVDMPLLRPHEVDAVVSRAVTFLATRYSLPLSSQEIRDITRRFDDVLSKRLRTPRAIKRLFGQVDAFLGSVGSEVDFGDYLVVTWLRTMEPGVYQLIQQRRDELLGTQRMTLQKVSAGAPAPEEARNDWLRTLKDRGVARADLEDVLWLLSTLFPTMDAVYKLQDPSKAATSGTIPRGKIRHPDYFDRFFAFGVPADDLPDAVAAAAIADLNEDSENTDAVKRLRVTFDRAPELALTKFADAARDNSRPSALLITWLAGRWAKTVRGSFLRGRIDAVAADVYAQMHADQAAAARVALEHTDLGLHFLSVVAWDLSQAGRGARADLQVRQARAEELNELLDGRVGRRLTELADSNTSPLGLDEDVRAIATYWRYRDGRAFDVFITSLTAGRWSPIDTLAWLLSAATSNGEDFYFDSRTNISFATEIFDLDAVASAQADQLERADDWAQLPTLPETSDSRRRVAAAAFKLLSRQSSRGSASPRS